MPSEPSSFLNVWGGSQVLLFFAFVYRVDMACKLKCH
jgi:hypothetical protein